MISDDELRKLDELLEKPTICFSQMLEWKTFREEFIELSSINENKCRNIYSMILENIIVPVHQPRETIYIRCVDCHIFHWNFLCLINKSIPICDKCLFKKENTEILTLFYDRQTPMILLYDGISFDDLYYFVYPDLKII